MTAGRRAFLEQGLAGAIAWAWGRGGALAWVGSSPCVGSSSTVTLVPSGEPGVPLLVSGTVFRPDGRTPAAGVTLYVYQTDETGYYSREPSRPPRIRGWLLTDADGSYRYRTIKPAPYPGRTVAAHIHTQLWGGNAATQWNEEVLFADDPLVSAAEKARSAAAGTFAWVVSPTRGGDGVLRCTHNIRLKPSADTFEESIMHGLRGC